MTEEPRSEPALPGEVCGGDEVEERLRRITPAHRHGFRTIGSAVAAGYRPCQACRPGAGRQ
jgi:hypothetical protein